MAFSLVLSTSVSLPRLRFLLLDFLVKMWLLKAFLRLILPLPVTLKRFLAPLFDFILGILLSVLFLNIVKTDNIRTYNDPRKKTFKFIAG